VNLHNGNIKPTVAALTCPHCGGLLIRDLAVDYRAGVKAEYYKCVQCARTSSWGPIRSMD